MYICIRLKGELYWEVWDHSPSLVPASQNSHAAFTPARLVLFSPCVALPLTADTRGDVIDPASLSSASSLNRAPLSEHLFRYVMLAGTAAEVQHNWGQ